LVFLLRRTRFLILARLPGLALVAGGLLLLFDVVEVFSPDIF